jgi:hypothetical protein
MLPTREPVDRRKNQARDRRRFKRMSLRGFHNDRTGFEATKKMNVVET